MNNYGDGLTLSTHFTLYRQIDHMLNEQAYPMEIPSGGKETSEIRLYVYARHDDNKRIFFDIENRDPGKRFKVSVSIAIIDKHGSRRTIGYPRELNLPYYEKPDPGKFRMERFCIASYPHQKFKVIIQ